MSALPFLPRKVAGIKQSRNAPQPSTSAAPALAAAPIPSGVTHADDVTSERSKRAGNKASYKTPSEEDLAALARLALSDYALWSDPECRRHIDAHEEGFIPLSYLLAHAHALAGLPRNVEAALARAIRARCAGDLEVRMRVTSPARANWYIRDAADVKEDVLGAYEIRRVGSGTHDATRARPYSKAEWDERTVYVENTPPTHRSIAGIARLLEGLIADALNVPSRDQASRVQDVTLPVHHMDKPGAIPKCKGFAFVVLRDTDDVAALLDAWPWSRRWDSQTSQPSPHAPEFVREASRFGFRALSKHNWDELKREYMAHRQRLLGAIASRDESHVDLTPPDAAHESREDAARVPPSTVPVENNPDSEPAAPLTHARIHPYSPFPSGCLVFVRNVHPQTNKTTLRTLFSAAFRPDGPSGSEDGVDYVDFNKGMDSCHLRLSSPQNAEDLVDHFSAHPTVQTQGLDGVGSTWEISPGDQTKPILPELVQGKREEMYWEKVPEKVRREAVLNALGTKEPEGEQEEGGGRKRKRRRRT